MTDIRHGVADLGAIHLAYEDWGNPEHPALLLIMGLGAQLVIWPEAFCTDLVQRGFRVIRFDNRDIGLSTKLRLPRGPLKEWQLLLRAQFGLSSPVPYTLHDMVQDTVGLLDHLGIARAHVVGASMGGMIGQLLAAKHPERVLSLGVLFSSTNEPLLPPPYPSALLPLVTGPGKGAGREALIAHTIKLFRRIGSPHYPMPDHHIAGLARTCLDRSFHPAGVKRHFLAVLGTGSLKRYSRQIRQPTVVVHGTHDPLLRPGCGKAVARAIPGAELHLIDGMGHDLPEPLLGRLADLFVSNARRAQAEVHTGSHFLSPATS